MWLHLEIYTDIQIYSGFFFFFFFLIHLKLRLGKLPIWFLRESRKGLGSRQKSSEEKGTEMKTLSGKRP